MDGVEGRKWEREEASAEGMKKKTGRGERNREKRVGGEGEGGGDLLTTPRAREGQKGVRSTPSLIAGIMLTPWHR